MATVGSVNLARPAPNPYKTARTTGIGKRPHDGEVEVRAPGPKTTGMGSGIVGDHIGDGRHHGGDDQALYAFAREDLDRWERRLGRALPNGSFGENLTTLGIDVNDSRMGERWRVGDTVELMVTYPRIPCATFRGWMAQPGWLRTFTVDAHPGAYLRVLVPGRIRAADPIHVFGVPDHDVTITVAFRALTSEPALVPRFEAAERLLRESLVSES